ncbi:predicted protein [Naegleria gruberi]|uniref:Predicted protein n=1 Tax=Naegleria gruberi TaxID=5762 RepID=D2V564_NAEGR|nr:uncharacterized protein NAEGRDRAFT_46795 [Naegleria gruberi]EFC48222.1 predicted protein [Naegleria gruberi]|eukprot:XP_002680966.1 predicted protein [Naegleria gruberi strain NEG-M]
MLAKQNIDTSSLSADKPLLLQLFSRLSNSANYSTTTSNIQQTVSQSPTLTKQTSFSTSSPKVMETKTSSPIISNITSSSPVNVEPSPILTNMTGSSSQNNSPMISQATLLEDSFEEEQLSSTMKKRTKKKPNETSPESSPKESSLSDAPTISQKLPPLKPITQPANKSPPIIEEKPKPKSAFLTSVFEEDSDLDISDIDSPTSQKSSQSQKSNHSQHSNHSAGKLSNHSNTSQHSNHSIHSQHSDHFGDHDHEQLDDHFDNHHGHDIDEFADNFEEDVDFGEENWDQGEAISEFSGGSDFNDNYSDDFKDNASNHSLNDFSDHTAHSENFDDVENVLDESF